MKNARIFSMSTVGIVKHYIHDYLMHAERTDFIGANGVGKSIIADLLQILFIYDTSLIQFGTDGLNPKDRTIYTLPYKQPHAYFFVNIELLPGQFITIGIMISARSGARIVPFVITSGPGLDKPATEISLSSKQLLFARDFTTQGAIPDIKALAQKFYEKGLYLNFYRTKEEVRGYYQFLSDKNITPINLVYDENLKAFAKVIQSFSKAKSLKLDNSDSIKQFLFDDADKDFIADYESQKTSLEKLLRQYEQLSLYIEKLRKQQTRLTQLKTLEKNKNSSFKLFKKSELFAMAAQITRVNLSLRTAENNYSEETATKKQLDTTMENIPALQNQLDEDYAAALAAEMLFEEYEKKERAIEDISDFIDKLKVWSHLVISEETKSLLDPVDIHHIDVDRIIGIVSFVYPFLNKYNEMRVILDLYQSQQAGLQQLAVETGDEIAHHQKWIDLLAGSGGSGLLQWAISRGKALNSHQEAVLIKYFDVGAGLPVDPAMQDKYVNVPQFLDELDVAEVNGGLWLSLGSFNQYLPLEKDGQGLQLTGFSEDKANIIAEKDRLIAGLKLRLAEIDKIKKGQAYDKDIIKNDFDIGLVEYSAITKIKEGLACIADIGKKIKLLEGDLKRENEQLADLVRRMTGSSLSLDDVDLKGTLKGNRESCYNKVKEIGKKEGEILTKLKESERNLLAAEKNIGEWSSQSDEFTVAFNGLNAGYFVLFGENLQLEELTTAGEMVEQARAKYQQENAEYERKYIETASLFEETSDGKSIVVSMEIQAGSFSFEPLEQTLLGTQIRHTDDIGPALQQATLTLLSIADNVRDNMIKIFNHTITYYRKYEKIVKSINAFFKLRKISNRFVFKVNFKEGKHLKIEYLQNIGAGITSAYKRNEIPLGHPVSEFIEAFFKQAARLTGDIKIHDLLNPKTYFELDVNLVTEDQEKTSGSTGETYSAIALLGIARLSLVETGNAGGLRFIILEETGSLDNINFSTFPAVAREFGYQIITMAPRPFGITLSDEWYLHYLIKGNVNEDINHYPTASFFYTKDKNEDLRLYLAKQKNNELD